MSYRTLSTQTVFTGKVFRVDSDRVRLPHGPETTLDVVRHPASVVLLPMPDPEHIVLARQFRYAIRRWIWELPAGSVDPGETPAAAAIRECHEEIGQVPRRVDQLGELFPTPGYCDELMIFFRLTELAEPDHSASGDLDEDIEARIFSLEDARELVRSSDAPDMKTICGLSLLRDA